MVDFEKLSAELQKSIKEHGDYLRPLWNIILDLKETDSDFYWFAAALHVINYFSCVKDPTPVHFSIVREFLESNAITDIAAVDLLTRELLIYCQKFQQMIVSQFSDRERGIPLEMYKEGECAMPSRDKLKGYGWDQDGCNLLDFIFYNFLETIGKRGKKLAKNIRLDSQKRMNIFRRSNFNDIDRPKLWRLWVNDKGGRLSIISPYLTILTEAVWVDNAEKKWKKASPTSVQKIPINLFNVMLTTKDATLNKLQRRINEISNKISETKDAKKLKQLKEQLKIANLIHKKANLNFPEDFHFSVYEQYAIYGGFKLLNEKRFEPVEMYFSDILEVLNFKINKGEITEIRKAFHKLTTQKFPCYLFYPSKEDPNIFNYGEGGDEPIFKIWEFGSVNLNIDLSDNNIVKKKLYLSIANAALLNDLNSFYSIINSNLLAELRDFKKVSEDDLYFLAFLLKEMHFNKKNTVISLTEICKRIKKFDWISEDGNLLSREYKRQMKNKVSNILDFLKKQDLITKYQIKEDHVHIFFKITSKDGPLLLEEL